MPNTMIEKQESNDRTIICDFVRYKLITNLKRQLNNVKLSYIIIYIWNYHLSFCDIYRVINV